MTTNALMLTLNVLPERLAVCRLPARTVLPPWASNPSGNSLLSITYTSDELSIVADQKIVPENVQAEHDWRTIKVTGPLDFALVGVLASLTATLAHARISLFALSTYDTDYLLVKEEALARAVAALHEAGHTIETERQ